MHTPQFLPLQGNPPTMLDPHFEARKNWKATVYTILVTASLLLLVILWRWPIQQWYPPQVDEGMEVNLGNSDQGLGENQPMEPGQSAPLDQQAYTPAQPSVRQEEAAKDIATDDIDEDAPVIRKPPVAKPEARKLTEKNTARVKPVKQPTEVVATPPVPPRPKAIFKGVSGEGAGGNDADQYKKGGNQGIAGGNGDQGRPGGDPDAKNYTGGGSGNSGISISRGLQGRSISRNPSFEDEFNENAKVAVDVKVDPSGQVTEATYQPRGSTTSNAGMKAIALRKARLVKFNTSDNESSGTLIFNFRLKN